MEHIGKIRSPKGSGRNFSRNNKIATESTIKSLVSVAIYFLKYLRTLIGYRFRDSEIYSNRINFAVALDAWIDICFPFRNGSRLGEHNVAVHKMAHYAL